ncbi:uncharacterized protein C2845_PM15G05910 [Panicum miliaceum]|uniref:Pectinesterase inhibitor domain-containing protein n=1 Tax=Panicum miliaceum TaxID=4540 RepID=A0A3L6QAM8_PANMI|nr:uncharacterized protein C2845_PM15G05910 [Panicum miliaceum]
MSAPTVLVAARECNKILLPHAASINGSYIRASLTAVTITVSELTALARELGELDRARPHDKLGGCVRTVEETVGGAKEQLATLRRLDAVGDEKMGEFDLKGVADWIKSVEKNFRQQCSENGDLKDLPRELPGLAWWTTPYLPPWLSSFGPLHIR